MNDNRALLAEAESYSGETHQFTGTRIIEDLARELRLALELLDSAQKDAQKWQELGGGTRDGYTRIDLVTIANGEQFAIRKILANGTEQLYGRVFESMMHDLRAAMHASADKERT